MPSINTTPPRPPQRREWIKLSDGITALVAMAWHNVMGNNVNIPLAVGIGIVSRIVAQAANIQDKQTLVSSVFSGVAAYAQRENVPKTILTEVSIGLIAHEVLLALQIEDNTFI